jgi:hypothetical protein
LTRVVGTGGCGTNLWEKAGCGAHSWEDATSGREEIDAVDDGREGLRYSYRDYLGCDTRGAHVKVRNGTITTVGLGPLARFGDIVLDASGGKYGGNFALADNLH